MLIKCDVHGEQFMWTDAAQLTSLCPAALPSVLLGGEPSCMQTERLLTGQEHVHGPNKPSVLYIHDTPPAIGEDIFTLHSYCKRSHREKERQTEWRDRVCEDVKDQKLVVRLRKLLFN